MSRALTDHVEAYSVERKNSYCTLGEFWSIQLPSVANMPTLANKLLVMLLDHGLELHGYSYALDLLPLDPGCATCVRREIAKSTSKLSNLTADPTKPPWFNLVVDVELMGAIGTPVDFVEDLECELSELMIYLPNLMEACRNAGIRTFYFPTLKQESISALVYELRQGAWTQGEPTNRCKAGAAKRIGDSGVARANRIAEYLTNERGIAESELAAIVGITRREIYEALKHEAVFADQHDLNKGPIEFETFIALWKKCDQFGMKAR